MLVTTTDPITGNKVANPEEAPYVIEGKSDSALIIYFESDKSLQAYKEFALESAESKSVDIYNEIKDNETMGTIN
jgi:hypothetical protein